MKYQVGELIDWQDDDPVFDDYDKAIEAAEDKSLQFFETFIGLWTSQEDGSELLAIFYGGVGYFA